MKTFVIDFLKSVKEGLIYAVSGLFGFLFIVSIIGLLCAYIYFFGHFLQSKGLSFGASLAIVCLVPFGIASLFSKQE